MSKREKVSFERALEFIQRFGYSVHRRLARRRGDKYPVYVFKDPPPKGMERHYGLEEWLTDEQYNILYEARKHSRGLEASKVVKAERVRAGASPEAKKIYEEADVFRAEKERIIAKRELREEQKKELEDLEPILEEKREEERSLTEKLGQLNREIEGKTNELSDLRGQIFWKESELEAKRKEVENVDKGLREKAGYIEELETSNKNLEGKVSRLSDQIDQLTADLSGKRKKIKKLNKELTSYREYIINLKLRHIEEIKELKNKYEGDIENLKRVHKKELDRKDKKIKTDTEYIFRCYRSIHDLLNTLSKIPITSGLVSGFLEQSEQVITRNPNGETLHLDRFKELLYWVNKIVVWVVNSSDFLLWKDYVNSEEGILKVDKVYELANFAFMMHSDGKVEPLRKEGEWKFDESMKKMLTKLDLVIARQERDNEIEKLEKQLDTKKREKENYRSALKKVLWELYKMTEDYGLKVPKLYRISGLNVLVKPDETMEVIDEENLEAKKKELEIERLGAIERIEKGIEEKIPNPLHKWLLSQKELSKELSFDEYCDVAIRLLARHIEAEPNKGVMVEVIKGKPSLR